MLPGNTKNQGGYKNVINDKHKPGRCFSGLSPVSKFQLITGEHKPALERKKNKQTQR
jgi:hypothetical protein